MRAALAYVRDNRRRHLEARGERLPAGHVDPYSDDGAPLGLVLPEPRAWLLRGGWRRAPLR